MEKIKTVFTFHAWWNGRDRQCSIIKEVDPNKNPPSSIGVVGVVHEYDTLEEAEEAREEEMKKG